MPQSSVVLQPGVVSEKITPTKQKICSSVISVTAVAPQHTPARAQRPSAVASGSSR